MPISSQLLQHSLIIIDDQATSFAIERNLTYVETSAKTGSGVYDTIDFLVQDAIKRGFYK